MPQINEVSWLSVSFFYMIMVLMYFLMINFDFKNKFFLMKTQKILKEVKKII